MAERMSGQRHAAARVAVALIGLVLVLAAVAGGPATALEESRRPVIAAITLDGDRLEVRARDEVPIDHVAGPGGLRLPFAVLGPDAALEGPVEAINMREGVVVVIQTTGRPRRPVPVSLDRGRLVFRLVAADASGAFVPIPPKRPDTGSRPDAAPASPDSFVVVLDPGHGGIDPGASVDGMVEKDITLVFARRLQRRLDAIPGIETRLTRGGDRYLPLGARVRRAVALGAGAFVSIHADIVTEGEAQGLAVYTLTPDARAAAAEAVTTEAPRDRVLRGEDLSGAGDDVTRVLVDLAQRRSTGRAEALAGTLLTTLQPVTPLLRSRPHRRGDFRVLRGADIPAVLVELGFLSSEADRERLADRRWQARVADAMADAIADWRQTFAGLPRQ